MTTADDVCTVAASVAVMLQLPIVTPVVYVVVKTPLLLVDPLTGLSVPHVEATPEGVSVNVIASALTPTPVLALVTVTVRVEVPPPLVETLVGLAVSVMLFGRGVEATGAAALVIPPLASVAVMLQVPGFVDTV